MSAYDIDLIRELPDDELKDLGDFISSCRKPIPRRVAPSWTTLLALVLGIVMSSCLGFAIVLLRHDPQISTSTLLWMIGTCLIGAWLTIAAMAGTETWADAKWKVKHRG